MTQTSPTTVSVIIPVAPEGHAELVLESLEQVDFPAADCEVLLAEGHQPSRQRNLAARQAEGHVLYFLDNDSQIHPDAFDRAAAHLADEQVIGVGGPNLATPPVNLRERTVGLVLDSAAGTSRHQAKYGTHGEVRPAREYEIILCNMCMRRETFLAHGGFDERLYPNEETEFCHRLRSAEPDRKLLHDPDMCVDRGRPDRLLQFADKIFNYGRGRMEQTLLAPSATTFMHLVPMFVVLFGIASLALRTWWMGAMWGVYVLGVLGMATLQAVGNRLWRAWPLLVLCYPITHLGYGLGQLWGLVRFPLAVLRRRPPRPVKLWLVKPLGRPWPARGLADRSGWMSLDEE